MARGMGGARLGGVHLMYVDESGDPGSRNSPTEHYVLAGICVAARDWRACQLTLAGLRARMEATMGLSREAEMHAAEFLGGAKRHLGLEAWQRVRAAQWVIHELAALDCARPIIVGREKHATGDVLGECWRDLCQQGLSEIESEGLLIVTDTTDGRRLVEALAGLDDAVRSRLIDEPFHRDSRESLLLQTVDLLAYLRRQALCPNGLFRSGATDHLQRDFATLMADSGKRERPGQRPGP